MKIAGSYTPLAVLTGTHAGFFLAGLWGAALAGASLIIFSPARLKWASMLSISARLGRGDLRRPDVAALTPTGFALILAAGVLYTLGVVFFLWERLPFHNTIWHVFVLAATFVLYAAVLVELSGRGPWRPGGGFRFPRCATSPQHADAQLDWPLQLNTWGPATRLAVSMRARKPRLCRGDSEASTWR